MTFIDRDPRNIRELPEPNFKAIVAHGRPDPADRLPGNSRKKKAEIESLLRDQDALLRVVSDEFQETREQVYAGDRRVRDLERAATQTTQLAALLAAQRAALAELKKKLATQEEERRKRAEKVAPLRVLVQILNDYVVAIPPGVTLAAAPPVALKLEKTETAMDVVLRSRRVAEEARAAHQEAINALITNGAAKALVRRHIEGRAEAGRPNVMTTLEARRPPQFAMRMGRPLHVRDDSGGVLTGAADDQIDVEATLAWLFKDQLIAAMERAIDEDCDDASALTDEERARRIKQAKADILAAERLEEAAIERAAESGLIIPRRPDADPRAVFGLADSCPEPRP
ncbi:MAG: hypothetical protein CTY36_10655 [Methylocystis sp.]|nr:MAG: hypothetical protein CTY36_10655 [Methylocystis sp.]PPD23865.1 MAG: hypothetical protein CTY30_02190 [Methylocystis sp.]